MRVTLGKDGAEAATGNAATGHGDDEHPDLARARDGHRTPEPGVFDDTLPVTERGHGAGVDGIGDRFSDAWQRIWSGEIWDIQPPSPRELADRAQDGDWWVHEAFALRMLARVGAAACVLWSVPLYTLAVLGQRPGRAITALLVAGLIWYLT
ncbi:hypothetical protein AB0K34_14085 [Actinomadura sp. NPDC049382]|uniref:hypothetical protein n=1 Tax=Actinomadura sp. NPDC049382 TaxID=3158220 RepID=UPI0034276B89